jgi:opacity protein-like surface antigen
VRGMGAAREETVRRAAVMLGLSIMTVVLRVGVSHAQDESADYARLGPYVGLGLTYTIPTFSLGSVEDLTGIDLDTSSTLGFDARGGYRFHPNFAAELDVQYYSNFTIQALGVDLIDVDGWSLSGNLKGYPLLGRFQPYGLFGLGVYQLHASLATPFFDDASKTATDFALRFGGGMDFYINRNWVLTFEVSYVYPPTSALNDFSVVPLVFGAQYRFD